jgi:hypothetical protein
VPHLNVERGAEERIVRQQDLDQGGWPGGLSASGRAKAQTVRNFAGGFLEFGRLFTIANSENLRSSQPLSELQEKQLTKDMETLTILSRLSTHDPRFAATTVDTSVHGKLYQ